MDERENSSVAVLARRSSNNLPPTGHTLSQSEQKSPLTCRHLRERLREPVQFGGFFIGGSPLCGFRSGQFQLLRRLVAPGV